MSSRAISAIQANRMADEDWEYVLGRLLESFERHGLFARLVDPGAPSEEWESPP
jgi:hypothetical protein